MYLFLASPIAILFQYSFISQNFKNIGKYLLRAIFIVWVFLLFLLQQMSHAQDTNYDTFIAEFEQKNTEAIWLLGYDRIAWVGSDTVMSEPDSIKVKLGREWFCYQDSLQTWHIFFGKLDTASLNYQPAVHYTINTKGRFERSTTIPDPDLCNSFARSIFYARYLLSENKPFIPLKMNTYVRKQNDTIQVWMLPAVLPDYTIPFGGEFKYSFNSLGKKLLKKEIKYNKFFIVKPDTSRKILLDYRKYSTPTVGGIFFVLQNYKLFKQISIETKWGLSGLIQTENGHTWVHLPYNQLPASFLKENKNLEKNKKKDKKCKNKNKTSQNK